MVWLRCAPPVIPAPMRTPGSKPWRCVSSSPASWSRCRWRWWRGWIGMGCSPTAATTAPRHAVADLLGWDVGVANRRVRVAEQVCERVSLDGQVLPALLTDTAAVFAAGEVSLRHVEVIADALGSSAAGRLSSGGVGGCGAAVGRPGPGVPAPRARRLRPGPDHHAGPGRPGTRPRRRAAGQRAVPGHPAGRGRWAHHRCVRRAELRRATHRARRAVQADRRRPAIAGRTPRRRAGRTVPPTPGRRRPADGRRAAPTPDGDRAAGRAGNPGPHRDARPRRPADHRAAADAGL